LISAVVTTRLVADQFTGRGMPLILDAEPAPLKMLASGLGLPRGTKRKIAIAARYMFLDRDVRDMISDVISISIEHGHGGTVRPSKVRVVSTLGCQHVSMMRRYRWLTSV
jgi:hypothetical protein